jgi:hypothetical protein
LGSPGDQTDPQLHGAALFDPDSAWYRSVLAAAARSVPAKSSAGTASAAVASGFTDPVFLGSSDTQAIHFRRNVCEPRQPVALVEAAWPPQRPLVRLSAVLTLWRLAEPGWDAMDGTQHGSHSAMCSGTKRSTLRCSHSLSEREVKIRRPPASCNAVPTSAARHDIVHPQAGPI